MEDIIRYCMSGFNVSKEKIIEYILSIDEISFMLNETFYYNKQDVLNISVDTLENVSTRIFLSGDESTIKLYEDLIYKELKSKASKITYPVCYSRKSQFQLDKESSIEFITNLEDMLFNAICKAKSARSN